MAARRKLTPWMIGVAAVTFLAGLLFGYDQGVISGALPLLQADLDLSTLESEIVTSWVTLGALFGALAAGGLADRIGRRWAAVAAGVLFAIGAVIEAVAPGAGMLTFGRVVTGLGVGFASVVAPLYAAEMAPKRLRGRFVSTYQLAITVGTSARRTSSQPSSRSPGSTGSAGGPLLFTGLVGMTVSLAAVGMSFAALENQPEGATSTTVGGIVTVLALVVFIASFAFSMGPIVWTLISEIYPNRVRGRAISVATAVNWLAAFLVAQFFLSVVDAIGESTTFFLFSFFCVVTYVFVWKYVPETKGHSLEEIQERWVKGDRMLEEEPAA